MKTRLFNYRLLLCLLLCLLPVTLLAEAPSLPRSGEDGTLPLTVLTTEEMEAIFARGLVQNETRFTTVQWEYPGKIILWDEGESFNGVRYFSNRVSIRN